MIAAVPLSPPADPSFERDAVEALLDAELAALDRSVPDEVWERVLLGPVRDVLARPAKRFRAQLVAAGWALGGGTDDGPPQALVAAIEVLHAGSLVVDDIEDDAPVRRGREALHRRYGVPVALNAGNWMYFYAFLLLDSVRPGGAEPAQRALHGTMLRAVLDCHAGQALDVGIRATEVPPDRLRAIVERATSLKSGSLTRLATELGAIAAGAPPERVAAIGEFGAALGLGLQMLDDLGSIACDGRLDKSREDLWLLRPTWPWAWLAQSADPRAWQRVTQWAHQVAERREDPRPLARTLANLVEARGRAEVHRQLGGALDRARALASPRIYAFVEAEVRRLEASYA